MTIDHKDLAASAAHIPCAYRQSGVPSSGTASDVGKFAEDTDDNTVWLCTSHDGGTLGWKQVSFTASAEGTTANFTFPADVTITGDLDVNGGDITGGKKSISLMVFSDATDVGVGDGAGYFMIPDSLDGGSISRLQAAVTTAGATGNTEITIHNKTDGVDVNTTTLKIADTATTGTAITSFANAAAASDDIWRVDVDGVTTTAPKGLLITIEFTDA